MKAALALSAQVLDDFDALMHLRQNLLQPAGIA
jgi:hypothetical protein